MTAPRFTLDTLQNIRFPADPDTPAEYTYTSGGGQTATLAATPDELTAEEQGAALAFILNYCRAQAVKRGGKRRRAATAAELLKAIAEYRLDLDAIGDGDTTPDYDKILDASELERIIAAATGKGTPPAQTSEQGAGTTGDHKQSCFHGE